MAIELPDTLSGDGVVLRRMRADDAGAFAAAFRDDPELGRLLGLDEDPGEDAVRERIAAGGRNQHAAAGLLLAALAAGIGIGSLLTGLRPPARSAGRRYAPLCGLAALGLLPLITTPALGLMLALAFLAGLCFAPVTTTQIAVLDEVAPRERPAEAFAWLAILYGAGSAAGAALGGQLVAADGPRAAIVAACAATAVGWLVATARAGTLSGPPGPP